MTCRRSAGRRRPIHRRTLEEKAEQAGYDEHVTSLVTAAGVWQVILDKGFQTLIAEGTEISVEQMMVAAREMARFGQGADDDLRWAKLHATQSRIVAAMREVCPPELHEAIIAKVEGRPWPPPSGGRLAVIEGDVVSGEFEPFGSEQDVDDDDED